MKKIYAKPVAAKRENLALVAAICVKFSGIKKCPD